MKIAQIFPAHIPPKAYGGIERIVAWLTEAVVNMGHEVVLVCESVDADFIAHKNITFVKYPSTISELDKHIPNDVDILHFHASLPDNYTPQKPYLITEHGNHRSNKKIRPNTVFLSQSHAQNHRASHFVPNGIPVKEYPLYTEKSNSMLFMAKLGWRKKNAKTAIHLALDTKTELFVCGGDLWQEKKINGSWKRKAAKAPYDQLLHNCGNVGGEEKLRLLKTSGILFYAVNWQEPFALAPHEAMATGTPVLCTPNGALAEYIQHERNGYVVSSYNEAIEALNHHNALAHHQKQEMYQACRETAYTIEDCATAYLNAYTEILKHTWLYPPDNASGFKYAPQKSTIVKKPIWAF